MSRFSVEPDEVDLPPGATAANRRLNVRWKERAVMALSQNAFRPYLYPVFTPAGVPVTAESPIDHPHHNSITVGADHFDCLFRYGEDRIERATYNFYINDNFQGRAPGRTLAVSTDWEEICDRHVRIVQQVEWQGPVEWGAADRRILARETRTIDLRPGDVDNVIDIRSQLKPTEWDVHIGPTRHAYFTVRLADGLRVVDGGMLLDSEGRRGGKAVSAGQADWVDASGPGPHGHTVGITVVPHPSDVDIAWYAHDWGTVAVNPFMSTEVALNQGEHFDLGVTLLVHDGDADEARVADLYDSLSPPDVS